MDHTVCVGKEISGIFTRSRTWLSKKPYTHGSVVPVAGSFTTCPTEEWAVHDHHALPSHTHEKPYVPSKPGSYIVNSSDCTIKGRAETHRAWHPRTPFLVRQWEPPNNSRPVQNLRVPQPPTRCAILRIPSNLSYECFVTRHVPNIIICNCSGKTAFPDPITSDCPGQTAFPNSITSNCPGKTAFPNSIPDHCQGEVAVRPPYKRHCQ